MNKIKIWFFGTPIFSAKILQDLINDNNFVIKFVVTNPDKPIGRKQVLTASETAKTIENLNLDIPVFKPQKIRNEEFYQKLKSFDCDYFIVVAYGKILPKEILEMPKKLAINVHWSILPKYRGASPIQSALLNWEKETWVTIMQMSEGMDEWDIILIEKIPISENETSQTLFEKFGEKSGKILIKAVYWLEKNELKLEKQNHNLATYCSKISKEDWEVDWNQDAKKIFNKWQAYSPWPWIFGFFDWKRILLEKIKLSESNEDKKIWEIFKNKNWEICVSTSRWSIILEQLKPEWKKSQNIKDFINWNKNFIGGNFLKK